MIDRKICLFNVACDGAQVITNDTPHFLSLHPGWVRGFEMRDGFTTILTQNGAIAVGRRTFGEHMDLIKAWEVAYASIAR